ncbi:coatomer epsilon subunit-domain-containing protein [Gymnopilus junonius]|uniref:Coatomer epsilon subunit-domain-containing protein n=1 Tax=Gymnopilus junonius TaxID=109634 RepID=A0A9P5NRC8_GYMJU|nr:coatomer epsilon subunit-domain-containing protein [Gymnopilus junonius]
MESSELYHIKQQFTLGAYRALVKQDLPDESSPDYHALLLYKTRAFIALNEPASALELIPEGSENIAVKAVASLARYVAAAGSEQADAALEELRDLSVEIEGDDVEGSDKDKALVRVLAGTAFARAGEIEEALETVTVIVQIYLSINRPDLARKQFDRSKRWAEDDLLLQLIESTIGLVTGKDSYSNTSSFYTEQLGNPSLTSPHLLTARGVTRILRGEIQEAKSDLEESLEQQKGDTEAEAAYVVAAGLGALKRPEAEELWSKLAAEYPSHPYIQDVLQKADLFNQSAAAFTVPPLAAIVPI